MGDVTPPRPLARDDNRSEFDCGRAALNEWFRRHSWHNQESGVSRTSVICESAARQVVGFVALSAGQIERQFLAKSDRRNMPNAIPVLLLGQLAIDRRFQNQGHAKSLLRFAARTCVTVSQDIGFLGLLTHPLDDGLRNFYCRYGFEDLPFDPNRSMMVRIADMMKQGL